MDNFYIFKYNQYYNRQVKRLETLIEYLGLPGYLGGFLGTNFVPGDGVTTTHIINYNGTEPDYAIVTDQDGSIKSRWFVMGHDRLRSGQYLLTLMRDLPADFYHEVINAKCFIEKATLSIGNDLIFNKENMTYNQIKKSETLLKDKTDCPWIVGYIDRSLSEVKKVNTRVGVIAPNYTLNKLSDYLYDQYTSEDFIGTPKNRVFRMLTSDDRGGPSQIYQYSFYWDVNGNKANQIINDTDMMQTGVGVINGPYAGYRWIGTNLTKTINKIQSNAQDVNWNLVFSPYSNEHNQTATDTFIAENGKVIKVGDDYYRIYITSSDERLSFTPDEGSGLYLKMESVTADVPGLQTNVIYTNPFSFQISVKSYRVNYLPIYIESYSTTISPSRSHLSDAPYDMFCIPYSDELGIYNGAAHICTCEKELALKMAQEIQVTLGAQLYDLQLVPYCPLPRGAFGHKRINLDFWPSSEATSHYSLFQNSTIDIQTGGLFWCDSSSFSTAIAIDPIGVPDNPMAFKIAHECDFYRMVSPNYGSVFEIKATSNNGLKNFTADCTYKPYTPYIKVAPEFGRLYGSNFDDTRGLILGGDFSLANVQSAWINYQLNNKNYQQAFDRQIDNLEFNQGLERFNAAANILTGSLTGASAGGGLGMMAGGGVGAAIGAGAGAIASAGAGAVDYHILKQQQAEILDYTKDQFGYQLGNIKAQPRTLNRVSSFNKNNKLFPILEYYTCTETEKNALRDKLNYNGMTVMAMGTINQYIHPFPTYIKGKIIRINIDGDDKMVSALADEINRGVFI